MNMKTINKIVSWFLYIGLPLVVVGLFIWQLDNLEKFFKKYPNAIDGATLVFVLITTTLSIIISYKSYKSNIKLFKDNKNEQSYKIQQLLKTETKDSIQKLIGFKSNYKRTQINIFDEIKKLDLENELKNMGTKIKDIREKNIESLIPRDFEKIQDDLELISAIEIQVAYYNTLLELIETQENIRDSLPESAKEQIKQHEETLMYEIDKLIERFK
ncbi:hypothetical protein [Staphylococcus epidermidis]|nr:hypothetical protein [Staphylococcus epidermidis]KZG46985.1 hypothetical protein A4U44_08705 [Staphylococcus epidermidis]KZG48972.1 hypothetical protein A4U48_06120 [Staphylococcus epidermidis]KZG53905.1 hypothetical protein A0W30_09210 [Staphylococcus epidermidis]KZG55681.1 hypothetical protein A0W31_02600 [Staphylococcus epidermidis]KZG58296.1 hypothetical protein A4R96_00030 [Staphylococcus epidermidis]